MFTFCKHCLLPAVSKVFTMEPLIDKYADKNDGIIHLLIFNTWKGSASEILRKEGNAVC